MCGLDLKIVAITLILLFINIFIDDALQFTNDTLNISLVKELLRNNDVTVTFRWPREDGIIYHINIYPDTSVSRTHTVMSHTTIAVNLTISYNIQYNVSIVSSLCGVTTTKLLKYGKWKR